MLVTVSLSSCCSGSASMRGMMMSRLGLIVAIDSAIEASEEKALEILSGHDVRFVCDMNMGTEEATAWGCDLTYDYVKINGDYRT